MQQFIAQKCYWIVGSNQISHSQHGSQPICYANSSSAGHSKLLQLHGNQMQMNLKENYILILSLYMRKKTYI